MNLFFIFVIKKQKREIKELDAQIEPDWPSPLRQQGVTEEERERLGEIEEKLGKDFREAQKRQAEKILNDLPPEELERVLANTSYEKVVEDLTKRPWE